ncbi:MAG: type IVB secretion system lipoprotein DotD [Rickettsiella sp.]|nr:type IVB secretion system lipoprotein DotD [Rickettsiella sp.]
MKKIIAAIILGLLTGCTTTSQDSPSSITPSINNPNSDDATVKLAEAARSVSLSLNELKTIEKASNPPVKPLPYPTSSGLVKIIASVDWSGPIEPLLEHIAKLAKYNFEVIGHRPAIPVLVTIMSQNTPLAYIIRNANLQAGTKADINVYPGIHTIELRYAKS